MVYDARHGSPWHGLGTAVNGAMTSAEALQLSGQNWEVVKRLAYARNPITNAVEEIGSCALYRSDNGGLLGVVGQDYEPIGNAVQFQMIDYLLEAENGSHYDTAGCLGRGERVWALARIPALDLNVSGDKHESYLLACTSHDMSLAFTLKLVSTRVVCQNTLSMALAGNGTLAKIRHTKSALDRIERAKRYMLVVKDNSRTLEQKLNILAQRRMTRDSMTSVLDRLFPVSKDENGQATRQTRRENILSDVLACYESNDGNANREIRGTAYNLLNAITEYTDHLRSGRVSEDKKDAGYTPDKARWESALFGSGESLKSKALEIILEDTAGNPVHTVQYAAEVPAAKPMGGLLDQILNDSIPAV
jgi:phage/plasmid-like protein (TIGR03299 family)